MTRIPLESRPGDTCWDYARRAWAAVTGHDMGPQPGYSDRPEQFEKLSAPRSPCVVLFESRARRLHVGVYCEGRVWHLRPGGAVHGTRLSAAAAEHGRAEFYSC